MREDDSFHLLIQKINEDDFPNNLRDLFRKEKDGDEKDAEEKHAAEKDAEEKEAEEKDVEE